MSNKYKHGDYVPTDVLCQRLGELSGVIARGGKTILSEFDMRIPAELDRDADIVISEASMRLKQLDELNRKNKILVGEMKWIRDEAINHDWTSIKRRVREALESIGE